ncbi:hypothetical protein K505DRAFT_406906, partial [Melanomma pulvis-pyrius CBS 109.77]
LQPYPDDIGATNIVFVPCPSNTDPNDHELSKVEEARCFHIRCAFGFLTDHAFGGLAPAFYILHPEFNKTITETSHLFALSDPGPWIFQIPLGSASQLFANGPCLCSCRFSCLCYIWGACASSFKGLPWSNIVAAFAGSPTEALGAVTVNVGTLSGF